MMLVLTFSHFWGSELCKPSTPLVQAFGVLSVEVAATSSSLKHSWSPMVSYTHSWAFCRETRGEQTLPSKGYLSASSPVLSLTWLFVRGQGWTDERKEEGVPYRALLSERVSSAAQLCVHITVPSPTVALTFPGCPDNAALIHSCVKCISCLFLHFKLEFLFRAWDSFLLIRKASLNIWESFLAV